MKRLQTGINDDLYDLIEQVAGVVGLTTNQLVRRVLEDHFLGTIQARIERARDAVHAPMGGPEDLR